VILGVDAWGPVREAIMAAEHVKEHERLQTALRALPSTSLDFAVAGVVALVALLRGHMDKEESAFLNDGVLGDDVVVADQSGG
jgi:hypothetical protein